jgi:glycosyltransferase involved in cell wall biosynthesis
MQLDDGDADLWWYPWNIARPAPRSGAVVATVLDVAPLAFPDPRRTKWWQNRRWRRLYGTTARRATLLIAISEFTASEVERLLDVPRERIRVTPLAADDFTVPPPGRDAAALARLGVRSPYVLAVNAADRRKNLALLDRAMPHVVDLVPSAKLVMVGPRRSDVANEPAWQHSTGFVSEEDLASLYRCARAAVVPSLYEGFGLPVLEAMRLGAPVICARTSSLPEVAGDAARYVSATDEGQLALAIAQLLTDDVMHDTLQRAGRVREAEFSWDRTARLTLEAFDAALGR